MSLFQSFVVPRAGISRAQFHEYYLTWRAAMGAFNHYLYD